MFRISLLDKEFETIVSIAQNLDSAAFDYVKIIINLIKMNMGS